MTASNVPCPHCGAPPFSAYLGHIKECGLNENCPVRTKHCVEREARHKAEKKNKIYEEFLHKINLACLCGDNETIRKLIANADDWSYAHRQGNGMLSEEEQEANIESKLQRLTRTEGEGGIVCVCVV